MTCAPFTTGKERDSESGLDYFGARYYSSNMGRWMSPDWADKPEAVPYSSLDNPQSLNLYGYVLNNPLSHADADGHCCESDFNSFSDHPGRMVGPSTPTDRSIASTLLGGLSIVFPPAAVLSAVSNFSSGNYVAGAMDLAGAIPIEGAVGKGGQLLQNAKGAEAEKGALAAEGLVKNTTRMMAVDSKTGQA